MNMISFIANKKNAGTHDAESLQHFVSAFTAGEIPDYQTAAWLMAVRWQGMSAQETADFTQALAHSGDTLDLSSLQHTVDKHSTGGVGDKISLVIAPLLAAAGATVAKMSGRGLGHTGGTVDKLESLTGFNVSLEEADFLRQAQDIGIVLSGQSKSLAPADGKLYALRDVTSTVDSLPLIASSIMSKKLASGAQNIVLDVKVGRGAFLPTLEEARALASAMVDIGNLSGRNTCALLSNMDTPLGLTVGNALEVEEAMACLQGKTGEYGEDVLELALQLAHAVLKVAGMSQSLEALRTLIDNGSAWQKFKDWITYQGGDSAQLVDIAPNIWQLTASHAGYVSDVHPLEIGAAVKALGGGRQRKDEAIDLSVGVRLHKKVGARVKRGEPLASLYHQEKGVIVAQQHLRQAYQIAETAPAIAPLLLDTL